MNLSIFSIDSDTTESLSFTSEEVFFTEVWDVPGFSTELTAEGTELLDVAVEFSAPLLSINILAVKYSVSDNWC